MIRRFQACSGKKSLQDSHLNGKKPGVVVHTCHPSHGKLKVGGKSETLSPK
jgi:hypothetical protein